MFGKGLKKDSEKELLHGKDSIYQKEETYPYQKHPVKSIHLSSLFKLPKKMKARLERIQRDFLWGVAP